MRLAALFLLAPILVTCAAGTSGPAASRNTAMNDNEGKRAEVTLDIYSGRPNPSWKLNEEQLKALLSELDRLPASEPVKFFDDLGYRGFQVFVTDGESGKREAIKACKGVVLRSAAGADRFLEDKERRVERLLLESGGKVLEAGTVESVRREIEPPRP